MEWSLWRGSELNLTQCWERLRKKSKDRKCTEEGRGMPKMGAITAKKGQSALLDFLSIRRSPWFDCSYFLEGLVDISLLSYFKSMCRGRKAPFPYHWEFSTLSCTLLGICRGRLVRDNFFFPSFISPSLHCSMFCFDSFYSCSVLQFALVDLTLLKYAHNLGLYLFYLVTSSTNIAALVQALHVERIVWID